MRVCGCRPRCKLLSFYIYNCCFSISQALMEQGKIRSSETLVLFFFSFFAFFGARTGRISWPTRTIYTPKVTYLPSGILSRPKKAHPWPETRVVTHRSCRLVKKCDLGAWRRKQKGKKRNSQIWQVTYLLRPPTLRYLHQSCHEGWGPEYSQPCQVLSKSVQGFGSLMGRNLQFSQVLCYGGLGGSPNSAQTRDEWSFTGLSRSHHLSLSVPPRWAKWVGISAKAWA